MELFGPNLNFDFMGKKNIFIGISLALIALSIFTFATKGLQFGIDFVGGTELNVKFKQSTSSAEVRDILDKAGYKDSVVQHFGDETANEFLIRLEKVSEKTESISDEISAVFEKNKGKDSFEIKKVDMVGPKVGSDLKKRGAWALFYAILGILIYVALRFDIRFSPGGVIALLHDVIITLGIFALASKKFDLNTLAAVMTIIGYSINDTIVIFDRIRENLKSLEGKSVNEIVNRSINETMSRTIITTLTVFLVVIALFFWGGAVIHDFAFALIVGLIAGTYSTIFIASPLFLFLHHRVEAKKS